VLAEGVVVKDFIRASALAVVSFAAANSHAAEAYLLRFAGSGPQTNCVSPRWTGTVSFYNANAAPADVKLLGISNGVVAPGTPTSLTIPPGTTVSLRNPFVPAWFPTNQSSGDYFFVLHVDVPPNVTVENRDEVVRVNDCIQGMTIEPHVKVSLPVVRELTPAGVPQVKVGTDAGSMTARQNVAIYNDADSLATARIQVKRSCDDSVVDERTITINPHTVIQANGLMTGTQFCPTTNLPVYGRYTVVTVDQPSFSIVSTITDPQPDNGGVAPRVELAIGTSVTF
jgi:hypothetical protein